jgi:hypothetical protein
MDFLETACGGGGIMNEVLTIRIRPKMGIVQVLDSSNTVRCKMESSKALTDYFKDFAKRCANAITTGGDFEYPPCPGPK